MCAAARAGNERLQDLARQEEYEWNRFSLSVNDIILVRASPLMRHPVPPVWCLGAGRAALAAGSGAQRLGLGFSHGGGACGSQVVPGAATQDP